MPAFRPLIIIGAPRSGTNILRDVLTALPGFATWPCDEINFVWKRGNIGYPYDDLRPEQAGNKVQRFTQHQFGKIAVRYSADIVVEKTCANSLRVDFVDCVVPDAHYVFLFRDGLDAVASAMQRWDRPVADASYFLRKARYIAPQDFPAVAWKLVTNRFSGSLRTWGPLTKELAAASAAREPTAHLCALQWNQCVLQALEAFRSIDQARWLPVRYEQFVRQPEAEIQRILAMLQIEKPAAEVAEACNDVSPKSVGRGTKTLAEETQALIAPLIQSVDQQLRTCFPALFTDAISNE
jgi:hypothetical protein